MYRSGNGTPSPLTAMTKSSAGKQLPPADAPTSSARVKNLFDLLLVSSKAAEKRGGKYTHIAIPGTQNLHDTIVAWHGAKVRKKSKASPGVEPGSPESKSGMLAVTS